MLMKMWKPSLNHWIKRKATLLMKAFLKNRNKGEKNFGNSYELTRTDQCTKS